MSNIAVVVTCHEPYLKWLPEALASINRQAPGAAEYVVVFDGCPALPLDDARWRVIEGAWRHPSAARNAGLAATAAKWVIFWDADNVMAEGYLAAVARALASASSETGIIYPDIQYCDAQMQPQLFWSMPQWDYWKLREENYIDTAAAWRREAVEMVGGWPGRAGAFEDFALALDVTALGWKALKLEGPPVLMRAHGAGRMQEQLRQGTILNAFWEARSLAVVSLLAGRDETFESWVNFLLHAELPPRTALYAVDNSGRPEFTSKAAAECRRIAEQRALTHVNFASLKRPYQPQTGESYFVKGRHQHVAHLYASVFSWIREDLVLTLEDDVEPPLDAVRRLAEEIGYRSRGNIGAVGAVYAMPHDESVICAGANGPGEWGPCLRWDQVPHQPFDANAVGGGCTVWANWALHNYPVHLWWDKMLGWDGVLCTELKRRGFRIRVHGGVRCQHHVHGRRKVA